MQEIVYPGTASIQIQSNFVMRRKLLEPLNNFPAKPATHPELNRLRKRPNAWRNPKKCAAWPPSVPPVSQELTVSRLRAKYLSLIAQTWVIGVATVKVIRIDRKGPPRLWGTFITRFKILMVAAQAGLILTVARHPTHYKEPQTP